MIGLEGARKHEPVTPGGGPRRFDMEGLIGYILLIGVLLSLLLIMVGVAWNWISSGQLGLEYSIKGMNLFGFLTRDVGEVIHGMFRPRLFTNLGIAVLMLTPYVRVLASVVYFAFAARNWKYTLFTSFVLAVLTYSLFLR
jgi:uncharacterized membrane protein